MELEKLRELLKELEKTSLEEIEIETGDFKLKAKFVKTAPSAAVPPPTIPTSTSNSQTSKSEAEENQEEKEIPENYYIVESPMVGTFYRAPAPGAEPFVKEGDRVEKGQVLCIIEALKVMNEIESEVSGIVRKILVENGQPVEYGQPLFYIEQD